jgi:hypothetical protein
LLKAPAEEYNRGLILTFTRVRLFEQKDQNLGAQI